MNFSSLKFRILSCFLLGSIFLVFLPVLWFSSKNVLNLFVKEKPATEQQVNVGTFTYFTDLKQKLINGFDFTISSGLHTTKTFDFCIDVYGLCVQWLNLYIIHDSHLQIVRQTNDALTLITSKRDYSEEAQKMVAFQKRLKEQNIPFVFLLAPHKVSKYDSLLPKGIEDYSNQNADEFLQILVKNEVPFLDLREIFKTDSGTHDRLFYKADTHWTEEYAFYAFCELAEYLRKQGFEIEHDLTDIHSCSIIFPSDYSLVGLTDRLGKYYKLKPDPLLLFEPKRKPNIQLDSPAHQFHYSGPYSANIIYDYYTEDAIITNADSPNKKKILFFSDSFGNAFVGFLALSCTHLECCRMNHFHGNLLKRINEVKPDYVIGLFTARDTYYHCEKFGIEQDKR